MSATDSRVDKLKKGVSYEKMQSRGKKGQYDRAVARRRAIVDQNKARRGRSEEPDTDADKAELETNRSTRKHNSRMSKNEDTGRANDPNYARKWKKLKAGAGRGRSKMRTKIGQALTKSRRGGKKGTFGGRSMGFGAKAGGLLDKAQAGNWWNKV
jgi:hypothetical protein